MRRADLRRPGPRARRLDLNFALTLEKLQAAFYTEVERNRVLHGALKRQADTVGGHERAHVRAFRAVLGASAIKAPHFDFGGATEGSDAFRRTAVAFEDLAVAAYRGQAPRIGSREYLASALAIHSVEARHAAWIRRLAGKPPVAGPIDAALLVARWMQQEFPFVADQRPWERAVVVAAGTPELPHDPSTEVVLRVRLRAASLATCRGKTLD